MASMRPVVSVLNAEDPQKGKKASTLMPSVFGSPLRPDLVRYVHTNVAKNKRQAYGVALNAGYQTSAESWGTGRAVSRIPRVPGGGTHRAGQAAFGNMCRAGGMFNPNKTWRRWHRKVNITQKRHAVASALAASAIPALVMARGHRIDQVPEVPLVITDGIQKLTKTRDAVKLMQKIGLTAELEKVKDSKRIRAGRGKSRNRRYTMRKGPLVIFHEDSGITRAFRNVPGVDLCHVDRLNLLKLAPGGSLGRLCVWSKSAIQRLQKLYGSHTGSGTAMLKKGYHLLRPMMQNADLYRIINSNEVQSSLVPAKKRSLRTTTQKNPLKNRSAMFRLNPAAKNLKKKAQLEKIKGTRARALLLHKKEKLKIAKKAVKKSDRTYYKGILNAFELKREMEEERQRIAKTENQISNE